MKNLNFNEEAWAVFQEAAAEKYDFTTCQRGDGSYYGTGGTCRKGSEVRGGVPKEEKSAKKSSGGGAVAPAPPKTTKKDPVANVLKQQKETAALKKEMNKDLTALAKAGKIKGVSKADVERIQAKKSGGGDASDTKKLRKDMISARNAEAKAKKARREAEGGDDKAKAKETRAAHIQAKKDLKAAQEKFQKAQASSGDVKRFGRESERAKATDKELRDALNSKQLSPTKRAAVERELRLRAAGSPLAAGKSS